MQYQNKMAFSDSLFRSSGIDAKFQYLKLFCFYLFGFFILFFLAIPKHAERAERGYPESLDGKVIVSYPS